MRRRMPDRRGKSLPACPTTSIERLKKLPDFFATRDTIRFEDSPVHQVISGDISVSRFLAHYKPLHPVSQSKETVL